MPSVSILWMIFGRAAVVTAFLFLWWLYFGDFQWTYKGTDGSDVKFNLWSMFEVDARGLTFLQLVWNLWGCCLRESQGCLRVALCTLCVNG